MHHLKLIPILAALLLCSTLMSQTSDSLDLVLKRAAEAGLIQEKDIEDIRKSEQTQSRYNQAVFGNMPESAVLDWLLRGQLYGRQGGINFDSVQARAYLKRLETAGLISTAVATKIQNFMLNKPTVTEQQDLLFTCRIYNQTERMLYGPDFQRFLNSFSQKTKVNQVALDRLLSKIKQQEDLTDADLMDYLPMPATSLPTDETTAAIADYYRRLGKLVPELSAIKMEVKEQENGIYVNFKLLNNLYEQKVNFAKKYAGLALGGNYLQSIYESIPFSAFNDALSDLGSKKRLVLGGSWVGMFWHKPPPNRVFLMTLEELDVIQDILKQDRFNTQYLIFFPEKFYSNPSPYNDWIKKWQQNDLITSEEARVADVKLTQFEATAQEATINVSKELVALTYVKSLGFYSCNPDKSMPAAAFKQAATEYFQKLLKTGIVNEALTETFVTQTSKGILNDDHFPPDLWTLSWVLNQALNEKRIQSTDIQILVETAKQRRIFSPQCTPPDLMSLSLFLQNGLNPALRRYQTPAPMSVSDAPAFQQAVAQFFDTIRVWFPAAQISNLQFTSKKEETQAGIIHQTIRWSQGGEQQKMEYEQSAIFDLAASYIFNELWEIIQIHANPGDLKTSGADGQPFVPINLFKGVEYNDFSTDGFNLVLVPEQDAIWLETQREVLETLDFRLQTRNY